MDKTWILILFWGNDLAGWEINFYMWINFIGSQHAMPGPDPSAIDIDFRSLGPVDGCQDRPPDLRFVKRRIEMVQRDQSDAAERVEYADLHAVVRAQLAQ